MSLHSGETASRRVAGTRRGPGPDDRSRLRVDLASRLRDRVHEVVEAVLAYAASAVPVEGDAAGDLRLAQGWRQVAVECLWCGLLALELGRVGSVPAIVSVQARRAARQGVEVDTDLERYRAAYEAAWDFVSEGVAAMQVGVPEREALLLDASTVGASLLAHVLTAVAQAHAQEREHVALTAAQRRGRLARAALAGRRVDCASLDYDLDAEHLGVVASGVSAERALEALAERLRCRLLPMELDCGAVAGWLGRSTRLTAREVAARLHDEVYPEVRFAVGRPGHGWEGYRRTHRLAQAALMVAERWPRRITLYEDVELLAQALKDRDCWASLIERYVEPLGGERELLDALRAYCEQDHSVQGIASTLKVDRHTVKRWIDRVEVLTGRQLDGHRSEIEAALKLAMLPDCPGRRLQP